MRLIVLIAAVAAALAVASPAAAREFTRQQLSDPKIGWTQEELEAQDTHSGHVVAFFSEGPHKWMTFPRRASCWTKPRLGPRARRVCNTARNQLRAHRWLQDVAQSRWERLYKPKPAPPAYPTASASSSGSGLYDAFLCIHRFEGAWNANTGNGYYGGLQMDWDFMRSYGGEYLASIGTADRWPPDTQIAVAIRAYNSGRGFGPWPNTRLSCGL